MNARLSENAYNESRNPVHGNPTMLAETAERRPIWRMDAGRAAERIVGESPAWRNALKRATQVAATETTVCLHGESGTGKEVVARYVHGSRPAGADPSSRLLRGPPRPAARVQLFGSSAAPPAPSNSSLARSDWPPAACCFSTKCEMTFGPGEVAAGASGTRVHARRTRQSRRMCVVAAVIATCAAVAQEVRPIVPRECVRHPHPTAAPAA